MPNSNSVIGALMYPRKPSAPARAARIEQIALAEAITVTWYDEADWRVEYHEP